MDQTFSGKVMGSVVEARFAFSGKLAKVNKRTGDRVKKGELLANLEKGPLQTELDRQLADFEKTRADFEIFNQKNPNPEDEITKYLKVAEQADLNIAVKDVELAKMKLDQCDLLSPIDGVVMDDGGNVQGIYITPSSFAFKIISLRNLVLVMQVNQKELSFFRKPTQVSVTFDGIGEFAAVTRLPIPGLFSGKEEPIFEVMVELLDNEMLLPGMKGSVVFNS